MSNIFLTSLKKLEKNEPFQYSLGFKAPRRTLYSLAISYRKYPFYSTKISYSAKIRDKNPKIFRQRGFNIQGETAEGCGDTQPGGMEEQPLEPPFSAEPLIQGKIAVFIVPQEGMPDMGKMAADLVHPSGPQFQFQEGEIPVTRQTGIPGPGRLGRSPDLKIRPDNPRFRMGMAGAYPQVTFLYTPASPGRGFSRGKRFSFGK
jgi:hypothetical protein